MRHCLIVFLSLFIGFSAHAQSGKLEGIASYYGKRFHGRRTANGEIFDKNKMTAAHRHLPFGTVVKVTRADNGNFIYVRINDRGPFYGGRLIDLSRKAAEELGLVHRGHGKVLLEVVGQGDSVEEVLARSSAIQLQKAVKSRLAFLGIQPLELPQQPSVSPKLKWKKAKKHIPASQENLPDKIIQTLVDTVSPQS